jgi:hypothetical protein
VIGQPDGPKVLFDAWMADVVSDTDLRAGPRLLAMPACAEGSPKWHALAYPRRAVTSRSVM